MRFYLVKNRPKKLVDFDLKKGIYTPDFIVLYSLRFGQSVQPVLSVLPPVPWWESGPCLSVADHPNQLSTLAQKKKNLIAVWT